MSVKNQAARIHRGTLLKWAAFLSLLGFVTAFLYFIQMSSGTFFVFMVAGSTLFLSGMLVYAWVLFDDFKKKHSLFQEKVFPPDSLIISEGDVGEEMYFIRAGTVEVFTKKGGSEKIIARLNEGDYFGEMALISDGVRTASVRAVTKVRVAAVGKANFRALTANLPAAGQEFIKTYMKRKEENRKL